MILLPPIQQRSLFKALVDKGAFEKLRQSSRILDLISRIWNIDLLPSTDARFNTMRGDIQQHYLNNTDWNEEYLFSEILGIYKDIEKYQKVIELIPSDEFQDDITFIESLVQLINSYLIPHKQRLVAKRQQNFTIYEVKNSEAVDEIIPSNTIPFFVEKNSNKQGEHETPSIFPSFVLAADTWDDFGVSSLFRLFYYPNESQSLQAGKVKIITRTKEGEDPSKAITTNYLKDSFTDLNNDFCSLGQEVKYYQEIKRFFPDSYRSILWALKDCAIFTDIEEQFEQDYSFKRSLLRENEAERLLRDAKFIVEGIEVQNREHFTYHFQTPFSEDETLLEVSFNSKAILPSRLFAVVGKNGVGKTQMISNLPIDLSQKKQEFFEPQLPLFSKIISVSTSLYDNCKYPEKSNEFNYEYIGLTVKDGENRRIITNDELNSKLKVACKLINAKGRARSLRDILAKILPTVIIDSLFFHESDEKSSLNINYLKEARQKLSSGESTLLYLLTCIVATLRYDTLLLFDEPETHLHPNAITTLISALYKLLEEFQSFAFVVTHSPLVIREIKSSHVCIMERFENKSVIRKVQQETLGANISVLVDEIFGNKDIPQYYREIISRLAKKGATEEEIYQAINNENIPLPIGLQVFIKSICSTI
jgi:hypothetical protein